MAKINQVEKKDYSPVKISYTDKDYSNILDDLINSISGITNKWNTTDVNDPGMVLVKLMAILGDMLFYNQDMQSLEVYPSSVTQRKNAAIIYKLIGYKMRWYKSATIQANVVNTYTNFATLPRFCTFTTTDGNTKYCTFDQYELKSNTNNNGFEELVTLVEGTPITPVRIANNPYPDVGKAWHTIYGYNYTTDDIVNNRIYLGYTNIDQEHIIVVDDTDYEWEFKENVYLTKDVGRFFEFGVDVNDQTYIEFVDYWENFNCHKFKIFFILSSGERGQLYANSLTKVTGGVWSRTGTGTQQRVYNVNNFIKLTHFDSTYGYYPETPNEARKNAVAFQNTIDTLITLADFERASLRHELTANVRATDLTNDPGIKKTCFIGDVNQDGTIDQLDYQALENYIINPLEHPLSAFEKKLADVSQDGDAVGRKDLQLLYNYLNPQMYTLGNMSLKGEQPWTVGNVAMKRDKYGAEIIDSDSVALLRGYLDNPSSSTLTPFQKKLCDVSQNGRIEQEDLTILETYMDSNNTFLLPKIYEPVDSVVDDNDLLILQNYLANPDRTTLTDFQIRLGDLNQDGKVNAMDEYLLKFWLGKILNGQLPKITDPDTGIEWTCGNITMRKDAQDYEIIDFDDVQILEEYIHNPSAYDLTPFELQLCDVNQDGSIDAYDLELLKFYVETGHGYELPKISDDSDTTIGKCGKEQVSTVELLDGFVVKLYILPTEKYEEYDEEDIKDMLMDELQDYKILPLTIEVDTHSINKYYWTVEGKFITKTPLSRDELQTIIININNQLRYLYAVDKVNFNTIINYKEVIENMLAVDNRILMIDLEPIKYVDADGVEVSKEKVTGKYLQTVKKLDNNNADENLHYTITLDHTTVLPGSIMIRVNGGQYTLRDNNNGEIYNIDNILQYKGSIDYVTGEIDLLFNNPVSDDLIIEYVHNTTNIAVYRNLSTQTFYYDSSSLELDATTQNLV